MPQTVKMGGGTRTNVKSIVSHGCALVGNHPLVILLSYLNNLIFSLQNTGPGSSEAADYIANYMINCSSLMGQKLCTSAINDCRQPTSFQFRMTRLKMPSQILDAV